MKPTLLWFALLAGVLAARPLRAQLPACSAFASDEAAAQHKAAFAAAVRRAGLHRPADSYYYKCRIDVTQEAALRRAGLDLRELERSIRIDGPGSYQEESLFADAVVLGTVVSVTPDSSRRACYHSRYKIQVTETWQGPLLDTVMVRLVTGPIGTSGGITFSGAPRVKIGQTYILHLTYVDFAAHAEANERGYATCANNATPGDFMLTLASPVAGNSVMEDTGQHSVAELADLRRNLQRIAAILDKEHFYQKKF